ncbi:MG2 domain-containing protein [Polymorphobacter fuscus]|uniref:Alpha-2-macroglobulin n=1 Tax=Sandarakinorhabdus fusca TaxID=1439888 RepID=A0A7C9GPA8_9SPHN|nr:MG2 domain-containing protein [Polymorphobacter fuscus]KAB7646208.1 alpha-2-macroglobulin [Polymorphobacter fuscus]MQT17417.1 alpha-2-macroglobulin [Polymorphobacter fuscus]NJC10048.1 hypothetical protein [Polymorphobacter fuscus]
MRQPRPGWLVAAALAMAGAALGVAAVSAPLPRVDRITPAGNVEGPEQATLHFSTPMVALGDPRAPAPATGNCLAGATARWADSQSWVVDFPRALAGGQRCNFDLKPGLRDAAGALVGGDRQFGFSTGGPTIRAATPSPDGGLIAEDQVFLLALNAPPTSASVAAHAACLIDGVGEAVPLDILPDATRDTILNGAGQDWQVRQLLVAAGLRKAEYGDDPMPPRGTVVAAKCRRALPAGGRLTISWGKDVVTANGLAAGVARRLDFKVRAAFTAAFECSRVNAAAACSPLEPMRLAFRGEVPTATALAARLVGPDGRSLAPLAPTARTTTLDAVIFKGPFAEGSDYRIELPADLVDDAGRPLANAARFPLAIRTGDFPPLAKFAATFGILEAAEGGVLPVTLRGVENPLPARAIGGRDMTLTGDAAIAAWLQRLADSENRTFIQVPVAGSGNKRSVETTRSTPLIPAAARARAFAIPRDKDPRAFEVVGIPIATRGFHVIELASPVLGAALLGPGKTRYVATGALVTDMAVHFQWGRGRSLAWVTRLSNAAPVANAAIAITDSCTGKTLWQGRSDAQGRAPIGDVLPPPVSYGSCTYGTDHALLVSARTADDMSFTLSTWGNGIQAGDFNIPQGWGFDRLAVHAVFDRTLLRAGETINMKLIARQRVDAGFAPVPARAAVLTLRHLGSDATFTTPMAASGAATWTAPASAPLGDYAVELPGTATVAGREAPGEPITAGRFSIEDFRLPTIRARVSGPAGKQVAPATVPLDLALTYLSGGGVAHAPVKLRTSVAPRTVTVPGYDDWTFAAEVLTPGIVPIGGDADAAAAAPLRARVEPVTLAANGVARVVVGDLGAITTPSQLIAEMDYDDANGEVATTGTRVALEPAGLRVGIRTDGWMAKANDLRLKLVVLDLDGKPVAGRKVSVQLFSRETYSYRKRLIGGFYSYDNSRETKALDARCSGSSDALGLVACTLDAGVSGEVVAAAETRDDAGHIARATTSVWLAGSDDWWFGGDNGDRMDVVPEARSIAAGGTARLQVRMPFREATALVSVLRDGVIDSFVTTLSGSNPVVEVKMQPGYAPNVHVSVLAVRGRVAGWRLWLADLARRWNLPWLSREAASPTSLVDLAKPSYRLGIATLQVGWDAHRLAVTVASDKPAYNVRSAATATVTVTPPAGRTLPKDSAITFAAIDEALLQLRPNDSWDVLTAMMAPRPLAVVMATAQTQVVGKRHYGRKAVAAGGGGGDMAGLSRRDFNPVLLWQAVVPIDAQGRATVPFRLNGSLSGFRLVAIATGGADLFGTGSTTIRTTQDLQILPGIPPLVRDGDDYVATALARNATAAPMRVRLTGTAGAITLPPQDRDIPAGGAANVAWRIVAPVKGPVVWAIDARSASAHDAVRVTQTVLPAVPDQVLQASLMQPGGAAVPVAAPAGALPGRGGIDIAVSRSLGGDLPGVRRYMAAYPYDCIEQRLSRAVATGDRAGWESAAQALAGYLDSDGLARFFPGEWLRGDVGLSAYILDLSAASGWPLPAAPRNRLIAGLTTSVGGQTGGTLDIPTRMAALAALATAGALPPALVDTITVAPDNWPTATIIDFLTITDRVATPAARTAGARAEAVLRSRLDRQGTTLRLRQDDRAGLLTSADATAARLVGFAVPRPGWRADVPLLARALMLRQRQGHWDTTIANARGTLAMRDFTRRFEAAPVTGTTSVRIGTASRDFVWTAPPPPQTLPWPAAQTPLTVTHQGSGEPWVIVTARAAVPLTTAFTSGFSASRSIAAVSQATPGRWTRGDVVRVTVTVTPRAPVEWVVINDPVPAGATILGGSMGGRSQMLGEDASTGTSPSFVERRGDAVHAHYAALGRAPVSYSYTVRLGSTGRFRMPPTRVEALYSPEMLALLPNAPLTVAPR